MYQLCISSKGAVWCATMTSVCPKIAYLRWKCPCYSTMTSRLCIQKVRNKQSSFWDVHLGTSLPTSIPTRVQRRPLMTSCAWRKTGSSRPPIYFGCNCHKYQVWVLNFHRSYHPHSITAPLHFSQNSPRKVESRWKSGSPRCKHGQTEP